MLEVLVNLVPCGDVRKRKQIAVVAIANMLTTPDDKTGDYTYTLIEYQARGNNRIAQGEISGHLRSAGAIALVYRILADALPDTAPPASSAMNLRGEIAELAAIADAQAFTINALQADIERIGRERDDMSRAAAELQARLNNK